MAQVGLPMVVSTSCDTVMIFTSRWFLSRLGSNTMNAAFGGGLASFAVQTFFVGLIGYSTAQVAQAYGAGRRDRCGMASLQAVWVALAAWPLMCLAIPFGRFLFPRLGLPPEQLGPQLWYFEVLVWSSGIGLLRGALAGYFSGIGRTRMVMLASLVSMGSNIPLGWTLIFGHFGLPALGLRGAAMATIAAGSIGLLVLAVAWLAPANLRSFGPSFRCRIDRELLVTLLRKGTPSGAEFFLGFLAFQVMVILLQRQGTTSATAASILFNWDMVAFVPLVGIEIGTTSLVGRYVGARRFAAVRRSLRSALRLGLLFSSVVFVAFVAFPEVLVDLFRPDAADAGFEQSRGLAITLIRVASAYVTLDAVLLVFAGALRGSGDTFWTMAASVTLHWVLVLGLWLNLEVLGLGVVTSWGILVGMFLFFPAILGWRWKQGRWRERRSPQSLPPPIDVPPIVA
jgi:multidrug resistance protein, MATE family